MAKSKSIPLSRKRAKSLTTADSPEEVEARWQRFLARYTPKLAGEMEAARAWLHARIPSGFELIYDNYNALGTGFGPTRRPSDLVVSLVAYPRWVTLFFLKGAGLADPHGLLSGKGARVRSIRLENAAMLEDPRVAALLEAALKAHAVAFKAAPPLTTVVQSVSPSHKPRRPG